MEDEETKEPEKMKKKGGRPRKYPRPEDVIRIIESVQEDDGSVSLKVPDDARIEVTGLVQEPTLANPDFDPFKKYKTDPKRFYYRALNSRPHNLRKREAQGYRVVDGAPQYGDLVLAKLPKDIRDARTKVKEAKTKAMKRSAIEKFKDEAEQSGIKTFEEK